MQAVFKAKEVKMSSGCPPHKSVRLGLAVFISALPCYGQGVRGLISGLVTDSTGGVIPATVVRSTNVATNAVVQAETSAQGIYTRDFLTPGQYTITSSGSSDTKASATLTSRSRTFSRFQRM